MSQAISLRNFLVLGSTLAAAGSIGFSPFLTTAWGKNRSRRRLEFDVCCNANSIRFTGPQGPNPDPNKPDDVGAHPYYGASFVVQGTIYPDKFFSQHGDNSGLEADGQPTIPTEVIGIWTCRGWFVGDSNNDGAITPEDDEARGGIFTPTGRFVATTQIYDLDPAHPGEKTLISEGGELIDVNVPFKRAVTGGTGRYRSARGEVIQTAIGANATGLFNFHFAFRI